MGFENPPIDIDMTGGLNTKSESVDVLAPDLIDLQNCIYTRPGAFERRQGSVQVNPTTQAVLSGEGTTIVAAETLSAASQMYPGRQSPLVVSGNGVYSYLSQSQKMIKVGDLKPTYETVVSTDSGFSYHDMDCAVGGGYVLHAYSQNDYVVATLFDETTRQKVQQFALYADPAGTAFCDIPTIDCVRVVYVNGYFVVGWHLGTNSFTLGDQPGVELWALKASDLSQSYKEIAVGTTNTPLAAVGTNVFSMDALASDAAICYATKNTAGNITAGVITVPFSAPSTSSTGVTTASDFVVYRFQGGANKFGILWTAGTDLNLRVHDRSAVGTAVTAVLKTAGTVTTTGGIGICNYAADSGTTMYIVTMTSGTAWIHSYNTTGPTATQLSTFGLGTATHMSRMIYADGSPHIALYQTTQKVYLYRLYTRYNTAYPTTGFPVAGWGDSRYTSTLATTLLNRAQRHITYDSTNNILYVGAKYTSNAISTTVTTDVYQYVKVEYNNTDLIGSYAEFGGSTVIASGVPMMWTGSEYVEAGFLAEPVGSVTANTAAGAIPAGTYLFKFCYAWTDGLGRIHRSGTSTTVSATLGAPGRFFCSSTAVLPTLKQTPARAAGVYSSNVRIEVYRTTLGTTGPFYYSGSTQLGGTYTDTNLDATISADAQIYTSGGVFDNDKWPAMGAMRVYQNRLFAINTEQNNIIYSKSNTSTEGPAISLFNTMAPGSYTERKYALAVIDQSILCFSRDKTYINSGEPANDQGQGATFGSWQLTQAETGCTKPKAIAVVPDGALVTTEKGVYLYDRAGNTSYVGAPVELYNGQGINNAALVTIAGKNQVRFLCSTSQGGSYPALVLVYDTFLKRWSRFTYAGAPIVGQACTAGTYWFVMSNGQIKYEREVTDTSYSDSLYGDSTIYGPPMYIRIGWVPISGAQGWGRVRRLIVLGVADWNSVGDTSVATLSLYSDYMNTADNVAYAVLSSNTVLDGDAWQFRIRTAKQKMESFSTAISVPLSTYGASAINITGLALEVVSKKGAVKLGSTKTFSTA